MKNRNLNHKDHWMTPPYFKAELNKEFNFDFDPCPLYHNLSEWDGLKIEWGKRNFINPPYSQKLKEAFVKKAIEESKKGKLCVVLLPVSTSTVLFHKFIKPNASDIRFVEKRIPFIGLNDKNQLVNCHLVNELDLHDFSETFLFEGKEIPKHVKNSGQHDSMIVVFGNQNKRISYKNKYGVKDTVNCRVIAETDMNLFVSINDEIERLIAKDRII